MIEIPDDDFESLVNDVEMVTNDEKRGKIDQQRQSKIINSLVNFLKRSMNDQERNTWALLLSLK